MCETCDTLKTQITSIIDAAVATIHEIPHPAHNNAAQDEWDNFIHSMMALALLQHHSNSMHKRDPDLGVLHAWRQWCMSFEHALHEMSDDKT